MQEDLYNNIFIYIKNKEAQRALELLKSENLDINKQNENKESIIEVFIIENSEDYIFISNLIVTFINQINIKQQNKFGMTILHFLLLFDFVKETILLINKNKENFKLIEDNKRETILTIAKKKNIENLIEIINKLKNKSIKEKTSYVQTEDGTEDGTENGTKNENFKNIENNLTNDLFLLIKNKENAKIINMIIFNKFNEKEINEILNISKKINNELFETINKFQKNKNELKIEFQNEEKNLNLMKNTKEVINELKEIFEILEKNEELLITEEVFEEFKKILPINEKKDSLILPNNLANKFTLIKLNDKINKNLEKN